jgi:ABC-type transporter Mla subunit MlaD
MLLALLQGLYGGLEELRMANQQQEAAVQAAIGRVEAKLAALGTQVGSIVAELARVREALAARTDVDLSQEVARLDAVVAALEAERTKLDDSVPDAPPPAAPAGPGA